MLTRGYADLIFFCLGYANRKRLGTTALLNTISISYVLFDNKSLFKSSSLRKDLSLIFRSFKESALTWHVFKIARQDNGDDGWVKFKFDFNADLDFAEKNGQT